MIAALSLSAAVALSSAGAASAPALPAQADYTSNVTCQRLIRTVKPMWNQKGWRIRCVSTIDGGDTLGLTTTANKTILIARNQSPTEMKDTIAHEWAHAEQVSTWTIDTENYWKRIAGYSPRTKFSTGGGYVSPSELWAANRSRCQGYKASYPYKKVNCNAVRYMPKRAAADRSRAKTQWRASMSSIQKAPYKCQIDWNRNWPKSCMNVPNLPLVPWWMVDSGFVR